MGLFDKVNCCICGAKVGMLTRMKLADGNYICDDCVSKCGMGQDGITFGEMNMHDVQELMKYTADNRKLYETRFRETDAVELNVLGSEKVFSADGNNGWWIDAHQFEPDLYSFDQISEWEMIIDTEEKSEEELKEGEDPVEPPRDDLPMCEPDEKITRMYVRITFEDHPYLDYKDIDVMNALFVTDADIEAGYAAAIEIFDILERYTGISFDEDEDEEEEDAAPMASRIGSPADELKKYKELLDMGAITEAEYNKKKKQLLGF
ncbi:MAG: DUF4428 domain-containing protein [Eubacteriales bacterium]|nr:DUF4428 domain-containing protein [Eubacteriales bacterium]